MKPFRLLGLFCTLVIISLALLLSPSHSFAQQISLTGTSSPQTGAFSPSDPNTDLTSVEFPGQLDNDDGTPGPFPGQITNRTFANGPGNGASVNSGPKAKSNPQFVVGFEGLNFYQQRYSRGGNQFSVEPPDQGLCAGNGFVFEVVNDVVNIFNTSGESVFPDNTSTNIVSGFPRNVNHAVDLNSFYLYPAAINRRTGVRGPEVTDPSCLYDAATQRWFVVVLTLDTNPNGSLTGKNHLDIAVSQTPDPTLGWNIYRIPIQNDGTQGTPNHHCGPGLPPTATLPNPNACLGDYPHIGADANGFYITTNEFCLFNDCPGTPGNDFRAAQIYAISKAQLAGGVPNPTLVLLDTTNMVNTGTQVEPGFTVWPAQSPGMSSSGDREYFLSSIAVLEHSKTASQIVEWTLDHTVSLDSGSPSVSLSTRLIPVKQYGVPPKQLQPGSGTAPTMAAPQGFCINDTTTATIAGLGCWRLLFGPPGPAHTEVISRPDSNDSRMQQVMYANGKLWAALDTALNPDGGPPRAGLAWYIVNPNSGKVVLDGYLGAAGHDFTYPAVGVTSSGRGVIAFTATGDSLNPSAAFASIDAIVGVGPWNVVDGGTGAAPDDGFTSYKAQVGNPPRTRWGDYGSAAVDGDSIWIASEYIAHACNYTDWGGPFFVGGAGDNLLGTCGGASHGPGARAALGNWSTRITQVVP